MVEPPLLSNGQDSPIVTVVVTAYNIDRYLSRCIDSLIHQTEKRFELIIVNDGSTDETASLADSYADLDSRISVIHQVNKGVSSARNAGLGQASGRYICFLDGDDWFEPNMIESMVGWCESSNADVVTAGIIIDFHDKNENLESSSMRVPPRIDLHRGEKAAILVDEELVNLIGYVWNKMYDRQWLISLEERFDVNLSLFEDLYFNSRVLALARLSSFYPQAFVHYVQRPSPSLGKKRNDDFLAMHYLAIQNFDRLLATFDIDSDARERRAIRASFRALRNCLNTVARNPAPVDTFKAMVGRPQAQKLLRKAILHSPRNIVEYGIIVSMNRGLYAHAILLSKSLYLVKVPPKVIKNLLSKRVLPFTSISGRFARMLREVKALIPERIKGPIRAQMEPSSVPELKEWADQKKVIITLAGFYQNLGDMALTYAQKKFIEETLPDYRVLLVPSTDTYRRMKALKKIVGPKDIVTTIAGGNMDDVYPSLENARRYIVRTFPNNPIISFPQTIAFTDTPSGQKALRRSARTYLAHKNLVVFGREPRTLELMKKSFAGADIRYCPDIVLSLQPTVPEIKRSGIMLTVRDDLEVHLTADDRLSIRQVIESKTDDLILRDTVDVDLEDCQPDTFEATLEGFWQLLSSRKVVVTDRLHCMIFCVITETPVIVLPNSNHKIKGTYEAWLKDHTYVRFLESYDPEVLSTAIDSLWDLEKDQITGPDLSPHYQPLRNALLQAAARSVDRFDTSER